MVAAVLYRFKDCQCLDVAGKMQDIPAGIYSVAELSCITVAIGNRRVDLELNAFNSLKAQGVVEKVR